MLYLCDEKRHLICEPYSISNLHLMAKELGIKECWFHLGKNGLAHYDIPKTRIDEITAKCKVISSKELINTIRSNHGRQN